MTSHRWVALAWATALVLAAAALERHSLDALPRVASLLQHEATHIAAHTLLYGGLAFLLAGALLHDEALAQPGAARSRRALAASALFAAVALTQELVQVLFRHRAPGLEEAFDLAVDVGGASLGVIVWARRTGRRRYLVARALGLVLHPMVLGPAGMFAVASSAFGSTRPAVYATLAVTLGLSPAAVLWQLGLRRGWFSDRDLSRRDERPPLLAMCVLCAALLWAIAAHWRLPAVLVESALTALFAAILFSAATLARFKVSGHVAVPVGIAVMLTATSARGPWPFVIAAAAVAWARVNEGRHSRAEVVGASGLAALASTAAHLAQLTS